jgi:hypothetical protein
MGAMRKPHELAFYGVVHHVETFRPASVLHTSVTGDNEWDKHEEIHVSNISSLALDPPLESASEMAASDTSYFEDDLISFVADKIASPRLHDAN